MKFTILASVVASAAAFAPAAKTSFSTRIASDATADAEAPPAAEEAPPAPAAVVKEMSASVPFLLKPKNLDGYVGNVGFDPLGLAEQFDIKWLRESEIKHGRAAMLATLGFVVQEYVTLPGYTHVDDSNLGPTAVGLEPMLQIILWMGVLEFWTNKGNVTMENMFSDPARVPGNLGFDPMGLSVGKTKEEQELLQYKEIKNGRLAMLAIGGMVHHNWVTGDALF
ncbi:chlorophyll A-B binding protein [Fragilaria crotonensis]|nr:chlorophyll A-B binding protein [Fragilaria crotonensis]